MRDSRWHSVADGVEGGNDVLALAIGKARVAAVRGKELRRRFWRAKRVEGELGKVDVHNAKLVECGHDCVGERCACRIEAIGNFGVRSVRRATVGYLLVAVSYRVARMAARR